MCGIAGVISHDGQPPKAEVLTAIGGALAHRGPDSDGVRVDGNVALVHRRLSIIDLATGDQPLSEIPWEVPPHVKTSDVGGPLKKGFAPPPPPGFDIDGKAIQPPDKLKDALQKQNAVNNGMVFTPVDVQPQRTVLPPKQVRVQGAPPKPLPPPPSKPAPAKGALPKWMQPAPAKH